MEINIYKNFDNNNICKLLEKIYHDNKKIFIFSLDQIIELDQLLWQYQQLSFLPHGTINDPYPELQPILISNQMFNLNNAEIAAMFSVPDELEFFEQHFNKILIFNPPNVIHSNVQQFVISLNNNQWIKTAV